MVCGADIRDQTVVFVSGCSTSTDASSTALSKLALVMHAKTLQRHCDAQGIPILAMSVFPGFAKTSESMRSAVNEDLPHTICQLGLSRGFEYSSY